MKIVFVWLCLLIKASAYPTEPPPNAEEKKPCCVGPPRLLFKGYDSKHGINVYLFEFPPLKNGSTSKVKEDNVEHSSTTSEGKESSLSNTEDASQHEFSDTETNTPAYPSGFNVKPKTVNHLINVSLNSAGTKKRASIFPETSMNHSPANFYQNEVHLKTNSSSRSVAQNDTEKNREIKKTDITVGDEAKNTEVGIANGHIDVEGYYSTDGIILTDISDYSDIKITKQDSNVSFPSKDVENNNMLDCSATGGMCTNTSKYTERTQVINPTTLKEVQYSTGKSIESNANVTQSSKKHTNKAIRRQKKPITSKDKANKQPDQPKMNDKQTLAKHNTHRNAKHSSKQRQRYAHYDSTHNRYRYRHHHKQSSSESTSDSSQQFG
ncbi:uncharacterized protein ACMZJ9_003269 isoform 2-T3 [Mantella aurantiaca]